MSVLDRFKKKKEEIRLPTEIPMNVPASLPEDLEKFLSRNPGQTSMTSHWRFQKRNSKATR